MLLIETFYDFIAIFIHICSWSSNSVLVWTWHQTDNKPLSDSLINRGWVTHIYIKKLDRPSLVHILACHLIGTKPLSEPTVAYRRLDPWECVINSVHCCISAVYIEVQWLKYCPEASINWVKHISLLVAIIVVPNHYLINVHLLLLRVCKIQSESYRLKFQSPKFSLH